MNYVARYATTEAGLRLVLQRRIDRWLRETTDRETAADRATSAKAMIENVKKFESVNGNIQDIEAVELPLNFGGPTAQA